MATLVLSPRYWSLQTVSALAYGDPLIDVIRLEMEERLRAIKAARDDLESALRRWRGGQWAMAILDTNVVLLHHQELKTFDWHSHLHVGPEVPLTVWIPIAVVDELDSLKQSRGEMMRGGKKVLKRTLARQALRHLNKTFPDPRAAHRHEDTTSGARRLVELRLLLDEPGRTRVDKVDSEVIDRAAGLKVFADKVAVVTYDLGMSFSARNEDVDAVLLHEDIADDPELGPFPAKPAEG